VIAARRFVDARSADISVGLGRQSGHRMTVVESTAAALRTLRSDLIDPILAVHHGASSSAPATAQSSSFAGWSTRGAA
jgi:hypothetical protein